MIDCIVNCSLYDKELDEYMSGWLKDEEPKKILHTVERKHRAGTVTTPTKHRIVEAFVRLYGKDVLL
jgi:hypothetical protein